MTEPVATSTRRSRVDRRSAALAPVMADGPLAPAGLELLPGDIELVAWDPSPAAPRPEIAGLFTYGHPAVEAPLLDQLPGLKVVSNYGVGVDHIHVPEVVGRGIPVGNTPGILDGATADMAFCLLLAAGRRLVEGDRYARDPAFTVYDPGYMLGTEIHGRRLASSGWDIGRQIARRAVASDMRIVYIGAFARGRRAGRPLLAAGRTSS